MQGRQSSWVKALRVSAVRAVQKEKEGARAGTVLRAMASASGIQPSVQGTWLFTSALSPHGFWMLSLVLEFPE